MYTQEAKYVESWPNTTSAFLAGADLILQWIGMMERIPCYSILELHQGLLPAARLASRKILIKQNIKKRTGPSLCVLCGEHLYYCTLCNLHAYILSCGGSTMEVHQSISQPLIQSFSRTYPLKKYEDFKNFCTSKSNTSDKLHM